MRELVIIICIVIVIETTLRTIEFVIKKCKARRDRQILENSDAYARSDFILKQTCVMFPEQYDVYLRETEELVGYFRLRGGCFTVSYPDCGGELIFCGHPEGDGAFEGHERKAYLNKGLDALLERLNREKRIYRS